MASPISGAVTHTQVAGKFVRSAWSVDDGLPNQQVRVVKQDDQGYLWIGTSAGLRRFDGVLFSTTPLTGPAVDLKHSDITAIEIGEDSVWVGTLGSGLYRISDDQAVRYTRKDGLSSDIITSLHLDSRGSLWVGSDTNLDRIDPDGMINARDSGQLPGGKSVAGIHRESDGGLWIATSTGLIRHDGTRFRTYGEAEGLPSDKICSVTALAPTTYLVGTAAGLAQIDSDVVSSIDAGHDEEICSVLFDRAGHLWMATPGALLRRLGGGDEFERYGLGDEHVSSNLLQDTEGNIWFGTRRGLHRLKQAGFRTWTEADGLSSRDVRAVNSAGLQNGLWIGTADGLDHIAAGPANSVEPGKVEHRGLGDVLSLLTEDNEGVWVGTGNGLYRVDDTGERSFPLVTHSPEPAVHVLIHRSDGLWTGTSAGILRFNPDGLLNPLPDRLHSLNAQAFLDDGTGGIWIGTNGAGLWKFADSNLDQISTRESSSPMIVNGLLQDNGSGGLLVGSKERGIQYFNTDTPSPPDFPEVPELRTVYGMLVDSADQIWMTGPHGICRVGRSALVSVLRRHADGSLPLVCFGPADGVMGVPHNGSSALWKDGDENLWFATNQGLLMFDPASEMPTVDPQMHIEELLVDGKRLAPTGTINLPPGSHTLEIRYTGIVLSDPKRTRFRYRLDGVDHEWIDARERRSAFYNDLPAGTHRFRLAAVNGNGDWAERADRLTIVQAPFFYQRPIFIALCVLLAIALLTFAVRARIKWLQRDFNSVIVERERIARDMHDTQAQVLTAASIHLEGLLECVNLEGEDAAWHLEKLRMMLQSGLKESQRVVMGPGSEVDSVDLSEALRRSARELTQGTSITFNVRQHGRTVPLPNGPKRNLYHLGQEAMTNAVRHGRPTHIDCHLVYHDFEITLIVQDNGSGFDPAEHHGDDHWGIRGMRGRVDILHGSLEIESTRGKGTCLVARVPV